MAVLHAVSQVWRGTVMARRVTLTYVMSVPDGDDDDCISDAESDLVEFLTDDPGSINIERTVKLEPSSASPEQT
jgi:hypothetical protein